MPLASVQCTLGDSQGLFVCELKAAPEPGVIVARDYQLQDLVRFCTHEHNFSVLTANPTFSLGDFDVIPITYCHLFLKSRKPTCLCWSTPDSLVQNIFILLLLTCTLTYSLVIK